jgi:hypothetical protein
MTAARPTGPTGPTGRRPPAAIPDPARVPAALRPLFWVAWRWAWRDGAWTKPPVDPHTGGGASSTDPRTWGALAQALARAHRDRLAGVGVPLGPHAGLVGIDLDRCVDAATGAVDPVALALLAPLGGLYTELSPSRTGLRALAFGRLPAGPDGRPPWTKQTVGLSDGTPSSFEVYGGLGRYLTITGWRLPDSPPDVAAADPDALAGWYARCAPAGRESPAPPGAAGAGAVGGAAPASVAAIPDDQLLARMFRAANGAAVRALWEGSTAAHGGDDSVADAALIAHLHFWTAGDRDRTDRLFRRSRLYREKWDDARGATTYGRRTLDAVFARGGACYAPRTPLPPPVAGPDGLLRRGPSPRGADPLARFRAGGRRPHGPDDHAPRERR